MDFKHAVFTSRSHFCRNRMNNSTEKTDNTTTGRNAVIFKQRRNLYMKATGIVRRIDDLGRIVIPKEIRRTMRIREGDPSLNTLIQSEVLAVALDKTSGKDT